MKFAVIGGGWRSEFFLRIAAALPQFEVCGVYRTSEEKAAETREKFGVPASSDYEAVLSSGPDFAVLSVPREAAPARLAGLMRRGIPVVCETPPAPDPESLLRLWEQSRTLGGEVLVAEQYFLQPYHSANLSLIASGLLGEVVSATNSMMHGYHGINMLRRYLGVGMENCRIAGRSLAFPITRTGGRGGPVHTGEQSRFGRDTFLIEFENGRVGYWDFAGEQYHSYIRERHLHVAGTRGEIFDTDVRYLTPENVSVSLKYRRVETGKYSNLEGHALRGLMLGERCLYQNPFADYRLNDDEIAVACLLESMRRHIAEGEPLCYPLAEALQDSYLSFLLAAARQKGCAESRTQPWARS